MGKAHAPGPAAGSADRIRQSKATTLADKGQGVERVSVMDDAPCRVALVTAGTGPMGRAVAVDLARRGWSLFLQHTDPAEAAKAAADEVTGAIQAAAQAAGTQVEVTAETGQISSSESREQLIDRVLEAFGRVDSAGTGLHAK